MKTLRKKIAAYSIVILFALSIALSAMVAADLPTYDDPAFIAAAPNPCGVNQTVTVLFGLMNPSPIATAGFNPATNWNGFTLTITEPNGNKHTPLGPFTSDATGSYYATFTATQIGNYTLLFNFPGQTINNAVYRPATATMTLPVQEQSASQYTMPPLPTGYWDSPINGQYRTWGAISGDWLQSAYNNTVAFNPYTTGPTTAHITWAKQQFMGGVMGAEETGEPNYYQAPTYQSYWNPPLSIDGKLYFMQRYAPGSAWYKLYCIDMRTGKELWSEDASILGRGTGGGGAPTPGLVGQIYDSDSANGAGGIPIIWNFASGTNYTAIDANSGALLFTVTNVPGTQWCPTIPSLGSYTNDNLWIAPPQILSGGLDPYGSVIQYWMEEDSGHHWLAMWNSTKLMLSYSGVNNGYLPPITYGALDWMRGMQYNVSIPYVPKLAVYNSASSPTTDGSVLFALNNTAGSGPIEDGLQCYGFSCKTGEVLWQNNFPTMFKPGSTTYAFFQKVFNGVILIFCKDTRQFWGINEGTGDIMWGPTDASKLPAGWDFALSSQAGYGNFYVGTYGGKVMAIDVQTGDFKWTYTLPFSGLNTPYGTYPATSISVANGCVFACTGEHTPQNPYWLGGRMYVINATTGDLVYSISGWWSAAPMVADGLALDHNCYDGMIYALGPGKSTTTVTAPNTPVTVGQNIVVTGSVMDASPGLMDYAGNNEWLPSSTPAIGDAYQTQWMEYLYQQAPKPTNATGVSVQLNVLDSNGNFRPIGTTTSDDSGFFSFNWKPDIAGNYTLYAVFPGSDSYYSSQAESAFYVDSAPTPKTTAELIQNYATTSDLALYIVGATIAIIIAIAVVGALTLRKRP